MNRNSTAAIFTCCLSLLSAYGSAELGFGEYLSNVVSGQIQLNEAQEAKIIQQLLGYPSSLPGLVSSNENAVLTDLTLLCDFRDRLNKGSYSYEELLISQLIDRIAFVSLSRYMVATGSVSPEIKNLCMRVSEVVYEPEEVESVFSSKTTPSIDAVRTKLKETKPPEVPEKYWILMSEVKRENAEKLKFYYRLLIIASESETLEEAVMKGGKTSDWNELFAEKDVPSLLLLLWRTDYFIHRALPSLALYIESCRDFSIKDDSNKITAVFDNLDLEDVLPTSYFSNESFTISISSTLRRLREGRLHESAGLGVAQKILNLKPDPELMVEKSLFRIESAKSQIKAGKSLKDGDEITLEQIEAFLRRKVFVPESGGKYQVGAIGVPGKFIYPDGRVINGTVVETLSIEAYEQREAEREKKESDEYIKELESKGIEVIVVP
ncbi:hypothetical protein P4C99_21665 [Pontiellaceae bacterium B1224]|nr:hypothetical protein [Pontiellaceae bacterium B1224]